MRRARRLAARVNFGWWLDLFLPCLLGLSVALSVAVLILRRGQPISFSWVLTAFAAGLSAGALICFIGARRHFYRTADGLVRLESVHRLHNRLTTAEAGVGEWPEPPAGSGDGLGWRWRRFMVHPVVSVILLAAAILVPIRPDEAEAARKLEEPLAWEEVEEWIDTLEEEEFVEPERLESIREQVQELRVQPMDEWYSHSSLEASDSLRRQTEQAIRELARDINSAQAGLEALKQFEDSVPVQLRDDWEKYMGEALKGLKMGQLSLDADLLKKLSNVDPSNLRQLTQAEMEQLMKALQEGSGACKKCSGSGTNLCSAAALAEVWCQGGISRGPGEAPMLLKEDESHVGSTRMEGISNPDFGRAALGDTLAVGQGEHEIDEAQYQGPQRAGTIRAAGEGGETVWRDTLAPDEQEVLKRYFK
jgi:hypothetical protein